jgi:hypothetical protein
MPTFTGSLATFGAENLSDKNPVIVFTPSSIATTEDGYLLATEPIRVEPEPGGSFEVTLVSGDLTSPPTWYTISIEWLDTDTPGGFTRLDFAPWKFYAPTSGGEIGDVGWAPSNPARAYFSTEPPPGSNFTPGTWWLDANPDDMLDPDASGILYEWS